MLDFRRIYKNAEEHTAWYAAGIFVFLATAVALQAVYSGLVILSAVIGIGFVILTMLRPLWTLAFLACFLPFESFVLKFIPDDIYIFARYFSEFLIYALLAVAVWLLITDTRTRKISTPINLPLVLFLVVAVASAVINFVAPHIAILGLRQIIRFVLVFFVVILLRPPREYVSKLTLVLFLIVLFEAGLGIAQAIIGEPLDVFLLPSETRTFGEITLTYGVTQTWDFGSRVFATLGRYDRLGTFLAFFLVIASAMLYEFKKIKERRFFLAVFLFTVPALILTYSRSAWFGFLLGFLFIALRIKKDRRVMAVCLSLVAVVISYLLYTGLAVRYLTDTPQQTLVERFFETFSYERWRGEYYGMGRLFWMVQTVSTVVPASPLFGFGPGQYGGGAVVALNNTSVYEKLGLPYGVYGTDGYIDNNWFSLWGETGTLGLAFYLWMYVALFLYSIKVYQQNKGDPFVRALALGFAAAMIAVALNAFLATFLEVRTLAFYLWLYGGFVVVLGQSQKNKSLKNKTN